MTFREAYEYALIECNKVKAPAILVEEYVYLFNKAVQQYINSVYNRCEYDQQSSDDLSWLQVKRTINIEEEYTPSLEVNDTIWAIQLPENYVHLLNCVAKFENATGGTCGKSKSIISPCKRLTADLYPGIMNNYYMKPSHKNPYYHIINSSYELGETSIYINIHSGVSEWSLKNITINYIKTPKVYEMSYEDLVEEIDFTEKLEFPDYVCYEVINIFVRLLLENASDPRLQTHLPINQTIASGLTQNV